MEQFITECLNGQKEAFSEIVKMYHNQVFLFIASRMQKEGVEDIVQETFLRAYNSLNKCNQPAKFSTWLFGIARNCMHEWLRKNRRTETRLDQEPELPVQYDAETDKKLKLKNLIVTLPLEMRQVLIMKYQGNMTCEEIAVAMDRPIGTVRSWLVRAHAKLRIELAHFFEG